MAKPRLSDAEAKRILLKWPKRTSKLWPPPGGKGFWLQAQPKSGDAAGPRLSSPGATLFSTQPDGLWVHFNGNRSCDLVTVEVCGTVQNLNDKRSRYIPSSHSIVLNCGLAWLTEETRIQGGGQRPRWEAAKTFDSRPNESLSVPVRHLRILYSLPNDIYKEWCPVHIPTGYEFFCPHSSLDSYNSQTMQTFLRQMSIASQFYKRL